MGGILNAKGGALIAALVELQHATAGELDFAYLARTRAVRTLQERCGHEVSAETVNELVEAARNHWQRYPAAVELSLAGAFVAPSSLVFTILHSWA